MSSGRIAARVTPAVVAWARHSARLDAEVVAEKAGISVTDLLAWENDTAAPSLAQVRKLATLYKRPLLVFYLPTPPDDFDAMKDFRRRERNLPNSPELVAALRWVNEMRDVAVEAFALSEQGFPPFLVRLSLGDNVDEAAARLRGALGVTEQEQTRFRDEYAALARWREALEVNGGLAVQFSRVDVAEARAFAIHANNVPTVAVNSSDAPTARMFSLLHEVVHLALGTSATCDLQEHSHADAVEVFCNAVAGRVLVPTAALANTPAVQAHRMTKGVRFSDQQISDVARRFRVSRLVVVRRLRDNGYVSAAFYAEKQAAYAQEVRPVQDGGPDYYTKTVSQPGKALIRGVIAAYHERALSANEAAAYLRVKVEHLSRLHDQAA